MRFGQFHVPFADGRPPAGVGKHVVLGIRPEAFEDATFAPNLPRIRIGVEVLEELGSDVHLFFHVDAPPISAEVLEAAAGGGLPDGRALFTARVSTQTAARVGDSIDLAVDVRRFHFFDPASGARLVERQRGHAGGRALTKQRETRESVLELIEPLAVGDAIPSERQLGIDLGVSRLTVRAALDGLVREGYLVRRRGAGTFVAEPKVAKGFDVSSFSEDMRARGLTPASRTLDLSVGLAGARLGRMLHVSPSERVVVGEAAPPRRR